MDNQCNFVNDGTREEKLGSIDSDVGFVEKSNIRDARQMCLETG